MARVVPPVLPVPISGSGSNRGRANASRTGSGGASGSRCGAKAAKACSAGSSLRRWLDSSTSARRRPIRRCTASAGICSGCNGFSCSALQLPRLRLAPGSARAPARPRRTPVRPGRTPALETLPRAQARPTQAAHRRSRPTAGGKVRLPPLRLGNRLRRGPRLIDARLGCRPAPAPRPAPRHAPRQARTCPLPPTTGSPRAQQARAGQPARAQARAGQPVRPRPRSGDGDLGPCAIPVTRLELARRLGHFDRPGERRQVRPRLAGRRLGPRLVIPGRTGPRGAGDRAGSDGVGPQLVALRFGPWQLGRRLRFGLRGTIPRLPQVTLGPVGVRVGGRAAWLRIPGVAHPRPRLATRLTTASYRRLTTPIPSVTRIVPSARRQSSTSPSATTPSVTPTTGKT